MRILSSAARLCSGTHANARAQVLKTAGAVVLGLAAMQPAPAFAVRQSKDELITQVRSRLRSDVLVPAVVSGLPFPPNHTTSTVLIRELAIPPSLRLSLSLARALSLTYAHAHTHTHTHAIHTCIHTYVRTRIRTICFSVYTCL